MFYSDSPLRHLLGQIGLRTSVPVEATPLFHLIASLHSTTSLTPPSDLRPESMLRSYQRYLADEIERREATYGAAEMSLGKTGATLTGVRRVLRKNTTWRAIVVGPKEVAKSTWPDEIGEWAHLQDLTYAVAVGTEAERIEALEQDVDLLCINRENLQWLYKHIGGKKGWRWQILIYDEASRLKGFTMRTKGTEKLDPQLTEFGVLAMVRSRIEKVIELSGTPSPNGVIDLGGQARILLGENSPLGRNKTAFHNRWFDTNKYTHQITPRPHSEGEIMGLMKPHMIGLRSQDYIDLPPQVFNPLYVNLSPKHMAQYKQFEKDLYSEEYDVEAVSRGVLTNKLLQFSNGGLYRPDPDDPEKNITIKVHDAKLKMLESIVAEAAGKPILIAYSFKFDKAQIKRRFNHAVFFDEEPDFVKKWNRGEIRIGVAHPASIGHGLNLQHGGNIQVWYGLTWSLELWDQFNRRLARPGQSEHSVFIHVIMARGTEDERQYERLQTKGITQDRITEHVRVRLAA